jgi:hypothetical protein
MAFGSFGAIVQPLVQWVNNLKKLRLNCYLDIVTCIVICCKLQVAIISNPIAQQLKA